MRQPPLHGLLLIFSFALTSLTIAQTPVIDSLHQKAKMATGDERVELFLKLADLARKIDADTAMYFARKGYDMAEQRNNTDNKIIGNYVLAKCHSIQGNYLIAQKYYSTGLDLAKTYEYDSLKAQLIIGIGNCLWHLGKHAESLENHFEGLRLAEARKNNFDIVSGKINIGMVYQSQEKIDLAEKYISEALTLLKNMNESNMQITAMHTLANIYGMQGKISEAMKIDVEGLELAEKTNNIFSKSLFYDNMANCYMYGSPPDYPKALEYFRKTLEIDSAFDNKKQMSDSYKNMGTVFVLQQKYADAVPYVERSIELDKESGFTQGEQQGYDMLSKVYNRMGRTADAYQTLQRSMAVKDSLLNLGSEARIAELQTFYETEKQKTTIELQDAELSKKNYIIIGTVILALLLGLLGFSAYRRFRLQQKAKLQSEIMKQQEIATKAVIEAEEGERQRIARDLHDGIGQMMSAAKMNLSAFESDVNFVNADQKRSLEKVIGLMDESCREIRSVSHNMMPNVLLRNSLAAALKDFIDKLDKKTIEVRLYTEGLDERLDANVETVLYRVIQECVNNVIKHSAATTLDISMTRDKEGISATIEDNGKGFDSTDPGKFDGIGLKNIVTRIEYLKGTVEFDSAPGRGTVVSMHVPLS
jgi:two-component system, NarL family, sensor kinase